MPIGALIGGVASVGGALLGGSASKKAAKQATQSAAANTAANNALTREMYGMNAARLDPYSQQGMAAGNVLSSMLLGPQAPPQPAPQAPAQQPQQYGPPQPVAGQSGGFSGFLSSGGGEGGNAFRAMIGQRQGQPQPMQQPQMQPAAPANPAASQSSAWDTFRNSTNYQWRLDQGNKGINQGYAANGMLESGAAMKGIADYNQNFASNELGNYQNLLAQQQGMGLTAASALAGVGQNMVSNVTANNNSAAQVAGQAAIQRGAATGNMYGNIAGAIGNVAGQWGQSSYRPPNGMMPTNYPMPQWGGGIY